ncbi:iron-sulfur cluster scaffold-like protein [Iodidimonas nitroreducens]|uniref:Iron-sulfur cluster scaffold-like protein n=1 Tax=Iodidimonas nitroreducens TaxID=1236968 RepID=A0A5A7N6M2_9PROT|nr:iron-sulfur cluster assembly scaffold protein [Iodidimonas nitroreducens]GAK32170.1 SUF system FeS assembly protein, NifU family [alpha proteobacterium Q-1]GER02676.1 iron-sulfur cluster scaffold-like protein [Iodidimonas nitroreducens]
MRLGFYQAAAYLWGMNTLYSTDILRLATQIPFTERLLTPDVSVVRTSRICGSRVSLDACFKGDQIARLGLDVRACALGQASSALVAPLLIGRSRDDIARAAAEFSQMLTQDGEAPAPPFDRLALLEPVRAHKARHASVMLIFDAALAAFDARASI